MAPINVTTSKQQITAAVSEDKVTASVSAGFGATGPSGVVNVTAPITNAGTTTAANVGLSVGSGLEVTGGSLALASHTHSIANVTGLQTALDGKQTSGDYATLVGGKIPSGQLPSYVDDVIEVATFGDLPSPGEQGKIYLVLATNKVYRWSGFVWIEIVASPGSTDSLAEGAVNLYFTNARALSATATAYAAASHNHTWADITSGVPSTFAPSAHAASHAADGADAIYDQDLNTTDAVEFASLTINGGGGNARIISSQTGMEIINDVNADAWVFSAPTGEGNLAQFVYAADGGSRIQIFAPLKFDDDTEQTTAFTGLPTATDTVLGGVKIGGGVTITDGVISVSTDYAAASHAHGNITNAGAIGTTSGLVVTTGASGVLGALAQGTAGQVLKVNGTATGVEWGAAAADVSIDTSAADVLSASSGSITADDPGADRIVFWDDSAGKLTHLEVGSGLSISGTTITAAVTPTVTSPSQITSSQNDYAGATADINRITSDAARDITGIAAGTDGQAILLVNVGSFTITLKHQSASSTAANRIIVPWAGDYAIPASGSATLVYDNTTARWRVL